MLVLPAPVVADGADSLSPALRDRLDEPGPHEVIVVYDGAPSDAERRLLTDWGRDVSWYEVVPAARVTLPEDRLLTLAGMDGIERIQPNEGLEFTLDSSSRTLRAGRAIRDLGYTGEGVGVAVVDSGIDASHPALEDRVVANVRVTSSGQVVPISQDTEGHGTHVAGVIASSGAESPSDAYEGVAPGAHLVGVDVSRDFTTATVLHAFDWILDHREAYDIRVVSASWGRTDEDYDPEDPIVRASSELVEAGIVVVFSSGNSGPGEQTLSVEAQNPDVISVGAVNDAAEIMPYSSRGPADGTVVKPDVVAPGEDITSTRATASSDGLLGGLLGSEESSGVDAYYATMSGTSQASPHVAGLAALLLDADGSLSPAGVKAALKGSAVDLGPDGPDPTYGYGLADAKAALHLVLGKAPPRNVLVDGGSETFTFRGEVSGTDGPAIQTHPRFKVHRDGTAEAAFPVKPGAGRIRVTFAWTPPGGSFEVYLSDGRRTLGPFSEGRVQGSERVVTFDRSRDLRTGEWTVLAEPGDANLNYRASVTVDYPPAKAQSDDRGTPEPGRNLGPVLLLIAVLALILATAGIFAWKRRRRGSKDTSSRTGDGVPSPVSADEG